uniref:Secreted protein n=1 Tax=Rhipicephalus appendiculatus TaxID=34631 RepID=A0A131YEK6_RHIAP
MLSLPLSFCCLMLPSRVVMVTRKRTHKLFTHTYFHHTCLSTNTQWVHKATKRCTLELCLIREDSTVATNRRDRLFGSSIHLIFVFQF